MPTLICLHCGSKFHRYSKRQKFCSRTCYVANRVLSGSGRRLKPKVCKQCKKSFQPRKANQILCSKPCVDAHKRTRPLVTCEYCGREFYPTRMASQRFCNKYCRSKWQGLNTRGDKSPVWTGGNDSYRGPKWKTDREHTLKRDNYTCQRCGVTKKQLGQAPDAHHIIPYRNFNGDWKSANRLENLVSLCCACHARVERNA